MTDDHQRPNLGTMKMATASPPIMLSCARCSKKHDGIGSRKWIRGTKLMICAACVEARELARQERKAA